MGYDPPRIRTGEVELIDAWLLWVLIGIGLVVAELATGTLFLLFLGVAALVGALVAFLGFNFFFQAIAATAVAVAGVLGVQRRRHNRPEIPMPSIDLNQPVVWEGWIDRNTAMGRVKYRGATWDAHMHDENAAETGEVLYIVGVDGNMLHVSKRKSA
jgi:membrane protein implicated in regulation of membrane protease activity